MSKAQANKIRLVEVGPRDGLQNEPEILSLADKVDYIELLADAGLETIEATSFVRPDRIPQMGDAKELYRELVRRKLDQRVSLPCLVPNLKGLDNALEIGVKEIALFTATSDEFNKRNINATIDESFDRLIPVARKARAEGLKIRAYISTVFGCPYQGQTSLETLLSVVERLKKLGAYEISLGDTIGVGHPQRVKEVIAALKKDNDLDLFAMHFHDTYGMALVNIMTSIDRGIKTFDASSAGLGGCPYARGATGNVATEDVLYFLDKMNLPTGVRMIGLLEASSFILSKMNKEAPSRVYRVLSQLKGVAADE